MRKFKGTYEFLILISFGIITNCHLFKTTHMTKQKIPFDFITAYNQFYIIDKENEDKTSYYDLWNKKEFNLRLVVRPYLLAVLTATYGHIRGEVIVTDKPTIQDLSPYDYVIESYLKVGKQGISFLDCPFSYESLHINVPPGEYRIRLYEKNVKEISDEDEGEDYYIIEIYPGKDRDLKIIKPLPPDAD